MSLTIDFHARQEDTLSVGACSTGSVFISARRAGQNAYQAAASVSLFLSDDQARALHAKLGNVIAERDDLEAAKAQVKATKEAA